MEFDTFLKLFLAKKLIILDITIEYVKYLAHIKTLRSKCFLKVQISLFKNIFLSYTFKKTVFLTVL